MIRLRCAARAAALALAGAAALSVVACGDGGGSDRQAAVRAYAEQVAEVTVSTRRELAQTSGVANYRDADAAAATTAEYAKTIRAAADELATAEPPPAVADEHRDLIALYRATADRLDALAAQFRSAAEVAQLTALAQALSGEVQTYSSREARLRAAIDRKLAATTP